MEIIAHLQDHAHETNDAVLFNECRELMLIVQSPSPYPVNKDVKNVADENNLPDKKDYEKLKAHFKYPFTKEGGGFIYLVNLLNNRCSDIRYAQIAYQIYISKSFMKGDFNTFDSWYSTFCTIVGCRYHKDYKPSKLKLTKEQESSFVFLNI